MLYTIYQTGEEKGDMKTLTGISHWYVFNIKMTIFYSR